MGRGPPEDGRNSNLGHQVHSKINVIQSRLPYIDKLTFKNQKEIVSSFAVFAALVLAFTLAD